MSQKEKTKFRQSAKWKKFRNYLKKLRSVDCVTLKPLRAGWNLHHLNLDEKDYTDISDETHFACLNKKTHDMVHFLYVYYVKDEKILDRLKEILDKMKELNRKEQKND